VGRGPKIACSHRKAHAVILSVMCSKRAYTGLTIWINLAELPAICYAIVEGYKLLPDGVAMMDIAIF
jgi:hypothetical protein